MGKHVQQHHSHLEELQQTEHMISRYLRTNLPILVPRYIIIFPNCRFFNLTAKMKWVGQLDAYSILALTWVHFLPSIMVVYRSPLICQEVIFWHLKTSSQDISSLTAYPKFFTLSISYLQIQPFIFILYMSSFLFLG